MRIAVSGAHRTGKTTLIEELHRLLPTYTIVDEPYHLLAQDGEFAETPCLEDFEAQLQRSLEIAAEGGDFRIFDRCAADILAYIASNRDSDGFDVAPWLPRVGDALKSLDLVVLVPMERRDPADTDRDDLAWRRRVDEELREILVYDRWELGLEILEVTGTLAQRARQVLTRIQSGDAVR